jgi:hypothetical protein
VEIIAELLVQLVFEVLFEGVFEGFGWLTKRRWGRLVLGVTIGMAGGLAWTALGHDGPPLVATAIVGAQTLAIPFAAGAAVLGRRLDQRLLTDLALVGAAVVTARWLGWALL